MNWRPTWVMLAAAAVLLAFIVLVEQPMRRQRELLASHVLLPGLHPSLITNIVIQPWSNSLIQAVRPKAGDASWQLVQPVSYRARGNYIEALLELLAQLEWVDQETADDLTNRPKAQEEYGFANPRFTIWLQGSGVDRHLEVGNLGVYNDTLALQIVGNNNIYQIAPNILRLLPTTKNDWRDRTFLNLTNLAFQTLSVRAAGKEFVLERDATNHLWFMRKPFTARARADTDKINELLTGLSAVPVAGFETDDPRADLNYYGLQNSDTTPDLALTFLDRTNEVAGLQLGHILTNYTNFAFARRDQPGNIVMVPIEPFKPWQASYTNFLDQHLISLSPSLIESIKVRGGDNFEVRKQTNGQWLVVADQTFAPDSLLMGYWLANLTNVSTEIAKTVVTDFSAYGLSNACLQYAIRFRPDAGAPTESHLDFGTNAAGKIFERCEEEEGVNSVSSNDFEVFPRYSWQLRDRQVWNFDASNVVAITIHQLGGELKYLRDPAGNWTCAPGYSSQIELNSAGIDECVRLFSQLRAIYWDWVGDNHLENFGFDKVNHSVEFALAQGGSNQTYRIQFGYRSPYMYPYASVLRDGRRMVFEFPPGLYENLVQSNLTVISARLQRH